MIKRENSFGEAMKFLRDRNNSLVEQHEEKVNQKLNETKEFKDNYYKIREDRVRLENFQNKILESCKDAEMATAIKAIFITALEAETLTDNGIILAEEMVTRWIEDEGGAAKIISENRNKTYLLNRICDIVEEAALIDMKSILEADDEDEDDITKEEDEEEVDFDFEEEKDGKKEKEAEEVIDDPESGEEVDVKEEEDEEPDEDSNGNVTYGIEGEKDPADVDSDNDDDEEDEDKVSDEVEDAMETEEESEDEEDDDEEDDDEEEEEVDPEPEDYDNKVLEDLDKEEDVQKAVALIRQRVADAEEIFIKNNAKDKEQINALLGKISDNIKTVEDMSDKDIEKGKDAVAQENVKLSRQKIEHITNSRPLSIMESFARCINKDIIRDEALKEAYIEEDGSLDVATIVESAKIMYGFLETLNTLQLKKVDEAYLKEIFK
jgi:hypothetical protein